jgi:hypothetical protein
MACKQCDGDDFVSIHLPSGEAYGLCRLCERDDLAYLLMNGAVLDDPPDVEGAPKSNWQQPGCVDRPSGERHEHGWSYTVHFVFTFSLVQFWASA